jgi:hypothetical protein
MPYYDTHHHHRTEHDESDGPTPLVIWAVAAMALLMIAVTA